MIRSQHPAPVQAISPGLEWLAEGGELGRAISAFPWAETPLGPLECWPQSLRTSVSLMLSSQHPMWIGWGPAMTFLYNDAYISVLSRAKHPWALGRPAAEVWAEIWDICGPLADKVFSQGEASFVDDVQLFMKRGDFTEETYYSFSYSPIRDERGQVGGLFCPSAEVTARILNARRLATLSGLAANSLVEKTVHRACTSAFSTLARNPQDVPFALFYMIEGRTRARRISAVGLREHDARVAPEALDLAPTESASPWPIAAVARSGQPVTVDVAPHPSLPDGAAQQRIAQAVILPVTSRGNDDPLGVLVAGVNPARPLDAEYRTFFDLIAAQLATAIQNARSAEDDRRRAEQLAELDRAKTTFFSNVSHELRTPLTLMLGPLEDIVNQRGETGPARELATVAHRNGLRLLKLVNTLLDFSRLEAGRMQAAFMPTELGTFTADLASAFRSAIEKAGIEFSVDCPPLSEPAYIDRELWEKIVLNLLSNAYKFTLEGRIVVTLREDAATIRLTVQDTGAGIPAEAQARLFERFYRIEGTRGRTQEGTGIGLALVQDLAKLLGGSVRVASETGRGSTFTVELPRGSRHVPPDCLARSSTPASASLGSRPFIEEAQRWNDGEANAAGTFSAEGNAPRAAGGRPPGRVLLVDDNADMRDYICRILAGRFEVIVAPDGHAALDSLERERPDLILSDVMMPRLDGFGLVRAVRAHPTWRTLPVILLSARAGEEARIDGIDHGADDYLVKPFSARELIARITTHLELARVRQEAETSVREADLRSRLAIEAADVGLWDWDISGNRVEWSERTRRILGTEPPATAEGRAPFLASVHPDDRARAEEEVLRTLDDGLPYRSELRIVRPDGEIRWIAAQGRRFLAEDGKPARLLGALLDITDQRVREQQLRDTRARLDATLDDAAIGTWTWDMATNRLVGDASLFRLFSFPTPEHEVAPLDALLPAIHAQDLQRVQESLGRALRGETQSFEEDYRVAQPDGSYRWVASRGRFRPDPVMGLPVMSGVLIDITARKQAEEERAALLENERLAREEAEALRETARALSTDLDLQSTVQKATDAATRLTGAKFGAFFYNLVNEHQESYVLYTLSGAPREAFEGFGLPRNTAIFSPTFNGDGIVRLDDVLADPRYGKNAPHHGMPKGHPPVRSYLSVPVVSRTSEVIGGMFFGHPEPAVFTERAERIAAGIAAQAAIAIDNAKLYQHVQSTVDRLNFSLSSLQLGDWRWDATTDLMTCSPRTAEIYGLPPGAKLTREAMRACIHPEDRDRARRLALRCAADGTDYDIEYRIVHPKLGSRWVAVRGRPVVDRDKKFTGMLGVVQDITERKHAELHLHTQKEVLERIVVGVELPEILESLTRWVEDASARRLFATILLMTPDGQHLRSAAGQSCPAAWRRHIDGKAIGPSAGSCGTAAFTRKTIVAEDIASDPRWEEFAAEALRHGLRACWSTPIFSASGEILGTFAIYYPQPSLPTRHEEEIVDVVTRTASIAIERKRAEDDLRDSRVRLEQHAQLLEQTVQERTARLRDTIGELEAFSYSISHDMRAPLRSMVGYADLLLKEQGPKLDAEAVQYLKRIGKNAERLDLLVRDVLAYSKVAKQDIQLSAVDLDVFVHSLVSQLSEVQRPDVTVTVHSPLPHVLAHEAYLSQIFSNLLGNAIKFATPGLPVAIDISATPADDMTRIEVRDNGIGIDPLHFSRIFEIFGRVYPDKKFEGTGIGLSIVKKAVQRMGGAVGIDSALGKGSTFWFTLRLI